MIANVAMCAFVLAPAAGYDLDFAAWPSGVGMRMDFTLVTRDGRAHRYAGLEIGAAAKPTQVRDAVCEVLTDAGWKVAKVDPFTLRIEGKGKNPLLWVSWKADPWSPSVRRSRSDR